MSLMTASQFETLTDSLAAKLLSMRSGMRAAAASATNGSIYSQIDAIGNAGIEIALGTDANTLDNLLWNNSTLETTYLKSIFSNFVSRVSQQIRADGTYGSIDAYLTGVGAQVSPAIAPLLGTLSAANVFSPVIATRAADKFYVGADGSLSDDTTDAGDADTADVNIFAADNDCIYIGFNDKPTTTYDYLTWALSTAASADVAFTAQYWNGVAYATLALQYPTGSTWSAVTSATEESGTTYGVDGFKQSGVVRYAVPSGWERTHLDGAGNAIDSADKTPRYYLRLQRTANTVVTPPVLTSLRCGAGMGICVVKADSSIQFTAGSSVASSHDAPNKLQFRALTPISANVTATPTYTNRAGSTGRTQAQSAWSSIDALDLFPSSSTYLTLQSANEGVSAVTGMSATTTAVAGVWAVESCQARTEAA